MRPWAGARQSLFAARRFFHSLTETPMEFEQINRLTREAQPVDFPMLRSYIRWAPSEQYVRQVVLPSLRRLHPEIWEHVESKRMQ